MAQQYKVFISSTYIDLKDHREHVIKDLQKIGLIVDPMEFWTASTDEPKKFSQARIEGCDLCILLVGFRRGFVPPGEALSITQLEYIEARERGIGVLVYMLDEKAPWPRQFDELDKDPEIGNWRRELSENYGVEFFNTDPRSIEVQPAISRWKEEMARSRTLRDRIFENIYKIDVYLLAITNGLFSIMRVWKKLPMVLLVTRGARDGREHSAQVIGVLDGNKLVLIARSYSESRYPVWYHNLLSKPNARVLLGGKWVRFTAKTVSRTERSDYLKRVTAGDSLLGYVMDKRDGPKPPIMLLTEPVPEK